MTRRPPGRRLAATAMLGALACGAAGCGSAGTRHASSAFTESRGPAGCELGTLRLSLSPSTASPGGPVSATVTALPDDDYGVEDVGSIGSVHGGRYSPSWTITVSTTGRQSSVDQQVAGGPVTENGVTIADNTFAFDAPPLDKGRYQVRFVEEVPALSTMPKGAVAGDYTLCATLTVS